MRIHMMDGPLHILLEVFCIVIVEIISVRIKKNIIIWDSKTKLNIDFILLWTRLIEMKNRCNIFLEETDYRVQIWHKMQHLYRIVHFILIWWKDK